MKSFNFRFRAPETLVSVEDYRERARKRLPRMIWEYVEGGADDRVTLEANRSAFDRWALVPRVLRSGGEPDLTATVAGQRLSMPLLLAPTGFLGLANWRGDLAAARAAEQADIGFVLSTSSSWSIEEVSAATTRPHHFQLYPRGGGITTGLLRRAKAAEYSALFVTVDVPVIGNREGERKHGMGKPPTLTPTRMINMGLHPRWTANMLLHGRVSARNLVDRGGLKASMSSIDVQEQQLMKPTFSWEDVEWIRANWEGKLFIKGVLDGQDAQRAVALGADGIVISNHGGRQLDHAMPTMLALAEVRDQLPASTEVLIDGGIRRGTDIVKALALGANGVLIGRPFVYGLAASGQSGVTDVIEILRQELSRALALLGLSSLDDISRTLLRNII